MSKNPYLSCCDGRHFVTQESRHRGFFGTTQDQIIARDNGIDIYNQISHISLTWVESGAGKDKDKMHLNLHIVKQNNKAKPTMPRFVVQHSELDVLSFTLNFMTAKKSASVTGDILMGDN